MGWYTDRRATNIPMRDVPLSVSDLSIFYRLPSLRWLLRAYSVLSGGVSRDLAISIGQR